MPNLQQVLRSVLAVVGGIVVLSAVVEGIEFGLVTLVNGEPSTDPATYYAIRNRPWFLILKLLYNTVVAVGAGYVVAAIGGRSERRHGLALAVVQTLAFLWALTQPEMRQWTPLWIWVALIFLTIVGVLAGASLRERRSRLRAA